MSFERLLCRFGDFGFQARDGNHKARAAPGGPGLGVPIGAVGADSGHPKFATTAKKHGVFVLLLTHARGGG